MPARSVRFKGLDRLANRMRIKFGKTVQEPYVTSRAELREWVQSQLRDDDDTLALLFLAMALDRGLTLAQIDALAGKQITLDLSADWSAAGQLLRVV